MPHRTICDVLEAMRKCNETKNYSYLISLIEEAQYHANAMESALWQQHDIDYLKKEIKKLEKKKEKLEKKVDNE